MSRPPAYQQNQSPYFAQQQYFPVQQQIQHQLQQQLQHQQQQQQQQHQNYPSTQNDNFICDHLATFTIQNGSNMLAQDGLERLKQMEQSTGIWTMRVQMGVKGNNVEVTDINTGGLIEEFPIKMIQDLQCIQGGGGVGGGMRGSGSRIYNNIILFTIFDSGIHELHLFQCVGRNGQEFVNFVLNSKTNPNGQVKQIKRIQKTEEIQPVFPEKIMDTIDKKKLKGKFETVRGQIPTAHAETLSDSVDRQVKLLDYLFSDIENFLSHLHQVAEAYKNKAKRKTIRSSGLGDGLVNMRCKLPPAKEFFDILQKFKLSFILIAKLKKIICNPNAPELVHFLFKPLNMIIQTNPDNKQTGLELASRVTNPLITQEVINLFENCLDTNENEIWQSLGPAWKVTKDNWHEEVPTYVPVFENGWQPPLHWMKEIITDDSNSDSSVPVPSQAPSGHSNRPSSPMTPDKFLKKLLQNNAKIFVCKQARDGSNEKELSVKKGDILEVLKDDKNWWKVRNFKGESGFVPKTLLNPY